MSQESAGTQKADGSAPAYNPLTDWGVYVAVFCGGFVGTLIRYILSLVLPQDGADGGVMYWGTFTANMIAAFVYAAVAAYLASASWLGAQRKERTNRALGMGLCGGLSTMSTLALEGVTQLRAAREASDAAAQGIDSAAVIVSSSGSGTTIPADAAFVIYVGLTFIIGVLLAYAGSALGAKLAAGHGHDGASAGDGGSKAATNASDGVLADGVEGASTGAAEAVDADGSEHTAADAASGVSDGASEGEVQ